MAGIYNKYIFDLPIIPKVISEIINIPGDSNISSQEIEDIIKLDPYLTSRILKIANSSYYARQREICSVKDATTLIGLKKIKTICLLIAGSEIVSNKSESFYKNYWIESINTAFIAKSIAENSGQSVIAEDHFTSGILHNIGQAILYNFSNDKYNDILDKSCLHNRNLKDLELEEFGISNHQVASEVLKSWDFPEVHTDVVEYYLNTTSHSKFQNIVNIVSISKLINQKITNNINVHNFDSLMLTYQSRLNLRTSQIEYYINNFMKDIENNLFYKTCYETLTI